MDLRKLRDKASEAFTKGKFGKAAELYAEYCEKDPKDIQARLRMGDAYAKAGDRPKAIVAYKAAAEAFAREGFLPRAIAASKLILELDPSHTGVQQMLAGLYARKTGGPAPASSSNGPARTKTGSMPAVTAASSRHAPIELPDEEPAPKPAREPIDLPPEPAPAAAVAKGSNGALPNQDELPPELQVFTSEPAPANKPQEIELEVGAADEGGEEIEIEGNQPSAAVRPPAPPPEPEAIELDLGTPPPPPPAAAASAAPSAQKVYEIELDDSDASAAELLAKAAAPVPSPAASPPRPSPAQSAPSTPAAAAAASGAVAVSAKPSTPGAVAAPTSATAAASAALAAAASAVPLPGGASSAVAQNAVSLPGGSPSAAASGGASARGASGPGATAVSGAVPLPGASTPTPQGAVSASAVPLPGGGPGAAVPLPGAAAAPATDSAPPGLRRRSTNVEVQAVAPPAPRPPADTVVMSRAAAAELAASTATQRASAEVAAPPAPAPAKNEVAPAPASRIFIPGASPVAAAPLPAAAPARPVAATAVPRPTASDIERALSRFDELSLDDAPTFEPELEAPAAAPIAASAAAEAPAAAAAPKPKLPSFTELELEGDSLLHAVEVAALAGKSQRGEAAHDEEEVFSVTAEAADGAKATDELPKIPLFSDLPPDAFIELFERCPLRRYGMNERIVAQGSVGDAFYVVCEGAVRVVLDDGEGERELAQLKDGAFFGEMALLSGAPRSASVDSASEDTQLLEISAPVLAQLSHRYPTVATALKKFCRQRMLQNVMNRSALFKPFQKPERKALIEKFRARDVKKGDVIIKEGAQTDGLYIVLSGEVEVGHGERKLAMLREGDIFGEISLLKKTPATATVAATRRTSLIRLPRGDFDALILTHPQILQLMSELTEERVKHSEAVMAGAAEVGEQGLMLV